MSNLVKDIIAYGDVKTARYIQNIKDSLDSNKTRSSDANSESRIKRDWSW